MSDSQKLVNRVRDVVGEYGSVLVAYSGGVDSAVVLRIASDVLGDRAMGCIGRSSAYPQSELTDALALAQRHHLSVRMIDTDEIHDANYVANDGSRCFHCRSHLFQRLRMSADELGLLQIADGVHLDDESDHAGGIAAARQHGVRSPLMEAGLHKADVRAVARHLQMEVWDKPAMACLASRIPQGTPVTIALLDRIGRAEQSLAAMGFSDFRVRHHGELARIELAEADLPRMLQRRAEVLQAVRDAGYRHVTIDLLTRAHQAAKIAVGFGPLPDGRGLVNIS